MRARLAEIEHALELLETAVIRIRHLAGAAVGRELQEESESRARSGDAPFLERREIRVIHREHMVELREILPLHQPRTQAREVVAATARGGDRAPVRRLTDVMTGGAGGIDFDRELWIVTRRDGTHHTFGSG